MTRIELEIDKFGRVLIPKKVREALNLTAGSKITGEVEDGKLHLQADRPACTLTVGPDGWPRIHLHGAQPLPADFEPVSDLREDRSAEDLAGWR